MKKRRRTDTFLLICNLIAFLFVIYVVGLVTYAACYNPDEEAVLVENSVETVETIVPLSTTPEELRAYQMYNVPLSTDLQIFVSELCDKFEFNPKTIYGIMYTESRFQSNVANGNCKGLMQVSDVYFNVWVNNAPEYLALTAAERDIMNPKANIIGGLYALDAWRTECIKRGYLHESDWLEAYNKGYAYFNRMTSTDSYSDWVQAYADQIQPQEDTL